MNSLYSADHGHHSSDGVPAEFETQSHFDFEKPYQQPQANAKHIGHESVGNLPSPSNGYEPGSPSFHAENLSNSHELSHPEDYGQMLRTVPAWPNDSFGSGGFDSMFLTNGQSQIIQNRANTVRQQFGQVTPPDDVLSDTSSNKKRPLEQTDSERVKSEKSERARNAANQRHAKTKQRRRDSRQSMASSHSDDEEGEDKKEKYREKNRVAAAKCRAKKKTNIEGIEERHRDLNAMNAALKKQVQELRGELTGLRTHALNHQDCRCQISRYNMNQARKMTMGADDRGMPGGYGHLGAVPSPDMNHSRSNSTMDVPTNNLGRMEDLPFQSFGGPSNYAFPASEEMGSLHNGRDQFDDFMQSGFEGMDFSQS